MKELLQHITKLTGLIGLICLTGCSDDSGQEKWANVSFEAQPWATGFEQKEDNGGARPAGEMGVTRAWDPTSLGYYLYDNPDNATINDNAVYRLFAQQKNMFYKSINVFFTRNGVDPLNGTFLYKTSDRTWRLNMEIEDAGNYYVYGYIPQEVVSSAAISGNSSYSDGAVLQLNGIKTVTHSDVCVIVGAKDGPDENTATSSVTHESLATGDFKVNAQRAQIGSESSNYIYLLFDHLYSALAFNFTIDNTYAALRTIRVRKLELIGYANADGTFIKAKYNVEVKLKGNTTGASPIKEVTFTPDPTSGNLAFEPIYEDKDGDGVALNPNTTTAFMGCFVPGQNTYFKLRTTYDVYDKQENLIRYGCEAENIIDLYSKFNTQNTFRGQMLKVTLKVIPTYLYVLSEPDMDNPTLKLTP